MTLYLVLDYKNDNAPPLSAFYTLQDAEIFAKIQNIECYIEEMKILHYKSSIAWKSNENLFSGEE